MNAPRAPRIAIACGGTGGHLFPGLAVAEELIRRGVRVTLLISPKDVDQLAVKTVSGMDIVTLPAVGLSRGQRIAFARGFIRSYRAARNLFRAQPLEGALAMGGFTSAPPLLAAKRAGAEIFLHESNTIPGRANRWLSHMVRQAFVGFPQAAARLHTRNVAVTGTPVRPQMRLQPAAACREALGLDPCRPVLLTVGGSQGATTINNLVLVSLARWKPELQFLHFTGSADEERVRRAYADKQLRAVVHPFFARMELALGAASVAISRAGASSLAELAAMRVPSVLIPFPAATDNHQYFNARAFEESGAAHLVAAPGNPPDTAMEGLVKLLTGTVTRLIENEAEREKMRSALAKWHAPRAAAEIADTVLRSVAVPQGRSPSRLAVSRGAKGSAEETGARPDDDARRICPTTAA